MNDQNPLQDQNPIDNESPAQPTEGDIMKGDYKDIKRHFKAVCRHLEGATLELGKMAILYRHDGFEDKALVVDTLAVSLKEIDDCLTEFWKSIM